MNKFTKTYLYITTFFTGAAVLVLEILGTRLISPFYGATIFVWTSLIVVTMGALALGYFFGGKIADKRPQQSLFFTIVGIAGILFFLPAKIDQWVLPFTDRFGLQYGPLAAAFFIFFIPLLLLGMVSPFAIRLITTDAKKSGSSSGRVFSIATLGSIFGAFMAGYYLIDKFSLTQSFFYTGVLLALIGAIGLFLSTNKKILGGVLIGLLYVAPKLPQYTYDDTYTLQVPYHAQSFYADLKVSEIAGYRCLAMNGSFQSCIKQRAGNPTFAFIDETQRIIDMRKPKTMLLLGMGTGNVLYDMPDYLEIDVVELDEKIFPIAQDYFDFTDDKYNEVTFDDARHFLTQNTKKYDLILVDTFLGNVPPPHMFSKEAMQLYKQTLADGGLVLINMEGKMGKEDELLKLLVKTADSVFPNVTLTATEPERFSSVLIHLTESLDYQFEGGGRFTKAEIDYQNSLVVTDDFNPIEKVALPKLKIFRGEMEGISGKKIFFSTETEV